MSVAGKIVLVAGATSASGAAACRVLTEAGARVVAVGRRPDAAVESGAGVELGAATEFGAAGGLSTVSGSSIRTEVCDLTDEGEVAALAQRVHDTDGPVDGVLHLVGGWKGGGGLAGQTEQDFRFLEGSFTALRHVSRAFDADLRASEAGRIAVVSSTVVARPLAGGANYAAVKAATEAWARAVAQGFAKDARDAGRELTAASVIFRVASLAGLEETLAERFVQLWATPATEINDTIIELTTIGQP